ncbi:MAG: hypothetical protein ACJA2S_003360 [Cyclobacteriaceae bacterium]|jgi:hypothetical protein
MTALASLILNILIIVMKRKFHFYIPTVALTTFILLSASICKAQSMQKKLPHFEKIIVSPHIELILEQGEEESVVIKEAIVSEEEINVTVVGKTLRIYLDDAKTITQYKKTKEGGNKWKKPTYTGKKLTAHVTYKNLRKLSVRGEEEVIVLNEINAKKFRLKLYGEIKMNVASMEVGKLRATLYGENRVNINGGSTDSQVLVCYGENKVDARNFISKNTKTKSFGESELKLNVLKEIRVTAFGESEVSFVGDARVNRGIMIGGNKIYEYY